MSLISTIMHILPLFAKNINIFLEYNVTVHSHFLQNKHKLQICEYNSNNMEKTI